MAPHALPGGSAAVATMTDRIRRAATLLSSLACLAACTTTPPSPQAQRRAHTKPQPAPPGHPAGPAVAGPPGRAVHRFPRPRLRRLAPGAATRCWSRTARRATAWTRSTASRGRWASSSLDQRRRPVAGASYEPSDGRYIVFSARQGRQRGKPDLPPRPRRRAADPVHRPGQAHETSAGCGPRSQMLYTSVPLDRTAQGGTRGPSSPRCT